MRRSNHRALLGAFVLTALALFLIGLLQAGAMREWLDPSKQLRLVLPDEGLFGLTEGAKVEILGTPAGKILRIVIDPDQKYTPKHASIRRWRRSSGAIPRR